jgi:NADPH:quinone reductase-like Zn-dependent oxidoreductase
MGEGVDPSWVGQCVWAFTGVGGGCAEQAIASAATLVPLAATVPAVDAVTLGTFGAVAHFGLRHARFAPGESVFGTRRGRRAGYDVIIDIVAGTALPSFFAKLDPNGRMVAGGAVAGEPPAGFAAEMFAAFQKSMSFATFSADIVPAPDRRALRPPRGRRLALRPRPPMNCAPGDMPPPVIPWREFLTSG